MKKLNQKKILIFFQSSIELVAIFNLMHKNRQNSYVILVTGNNKLLYVLQKLNLEKKFKVKIFNFCARSLKNPLNILYMFFQYNLGKNFRSILKYNFDEAFIFNLHEDFVAPIFLSKCKIKKITKLMVYEGKKYKKYEKNFPFKNLKKINLIYRIKFFIFKFLQNDTNIKLRLQKNKYYQLIYFDLFGKKIYNRFPSQKKIIFFKIFTEKKYKKKKKILYIDSNEESRIGLKFKLITKKILYLLESKDYHVVIKKHLRENLSKSLSGYRNRTYITDPIPIELYDLNKIKIVISLESAAIAQVADKYPSTKCISTAKLILSKKYAEKTIKFLNLISLKNKICFLNKISYIKKLI